MDEGFNFNNIKSIEKKLEPKSFEEQWENSEHIKVLGSGSYGDTSGFSPTVMLRALGFGKHGLKSEYFDVHDISPEKPKTEVPVVIALGWGAIPESRKKHVKSLVEEHGRRVIVSDTPHGISAEKKENYPGIEIEKMTALLETLRTKGIHMKEDGGATGQIDLVAHSEGAIYSILLAYLYPQLVRNLVLENPAGLVGKTNIGTFAPRWFRQMKQQIFKEYKEKGPQAENYLNEVLNRNLPKAIESVSAISAADMSEMLKEIKAKGIGVAIITTTEDKFFPAGKILSNLNEEHYDILRAEDGTHDSTYYRPEEFAGLEAKAIEDLEKGKEKKS